MTKRLPSLLLGAFLFIVILSGSTFSAEAKAPQLDPLGLREWNIHFVDERESVMPTSLFRDVAEEVGAEETDWFLSFDLDGEFIVLSPFDLFTWNFYSEDPDYLAYLRSEYENKYVSASYADGFTTVSSSPSSFDVCEPMPCGAGGSSFQSLTTDRHSNFTGYGVKVTVTVEVYSAWPGGSTVYFEVLDVSHTYEKSDASPSSIKLDPVTDMKVDQSVGSGTRAYANVSVQTRYNTFSFSEWPAHFSFLWEDGFYTGTRNP